MEISEIQERFRQILEKHLTGNNESPTKEGGRKSWLWSFLDVQGVEPTNNASKRAVRPAVIWRKLSFGTKRVRGSRFVETIPTVVETCHRQSRNSFEYLAAAIQAHCAGQPAPSILSGV